jgi:transcriptional regulator with XRE-family HTH domain
MSPKQCRDARALLRWSTFQLADKAGVPQQTVRDFQAGRHIPTASSIQAVRRTFEDAGVDFYRRAGAEWIAAKPGVVERAGRAAGR